LKASVVRQGDGTYRVLIDGCVGVLLATSLADAMALAYRLAVESQLQG
jgi:hypothetical protein